MINLLISPITKKTKKMSNVPAIEKKVNEVNRLISLAIDKNGNPLSVVDNSGTWQSPMKYKPVKYVNGTLYVEYEELDLYTHNRSKGVNSNWELVKEKTLKDNMEFDNPLNNIAKMYRKVLKENDIVFEGGGSIDVISEKYPDLKKGQMYTSWYRREENSFFVYDVDGDNLTIRINGVNTVKTVKEFEDFIEQYKLVPQYKMKNGGQVDDEEYEEEELSDEEIEDAHEFVINAIKVLAKRHNATYNYTLSNEGGKTLSFEFPTTQDKINFNTELIEMNEGTLSYENGGSVTVTLNEKNKGMYDDYWTKKDVKELISKAKKHKKQSGKDYLVYYSDNGEKLGTILKSELMSFPQNYIDAHTIIFDTTELTKVDEILVSLNFQGEKKPILFKKGKDNLYRGKSFETGKDYTYSYNTLQSFIENVPQTTNDMKNNNVNKMDDGGLINTEEMTVDKGQPLSDPTIQNADIGSQSYVPKSLVCETVDTVAPVSMLYEMNKSLTEIDREVRGIDDFVRTKLGYSDMMEMCRALSAEQVDAIANAIYQIEKGQALIVGDMTGVGKGRIAAGIIRYAKRIGKTPIFFTEKPNLFSDIYRDIIAIGSDDGVPLYYAGKEIEKIKQVTRKVIVDRIMEDIEDGDFELEYNPDKLFTKGYEKETKSCIEEYRDLYFPSDVIKEVQYIRNDDYKKQTKNAIQLIPFIVNGRSAKTEIKDESGNIIYEGISNSKPEMKLKKAFESKNLPKGYDVVLLTYSQVNSPSRAIDKIQWLNSVGNDSIVIMDESHNASGSSQTGAFLQEFIKKTAGVCFLSATFAKRPDNMPIYAMKTAIQDAELSNDKLISAILSGGVALQEILSNELVSEGQMLRRERSYEGVVVNYNYLDERMLDRDVPLPNFNLKEAHEAVSDKVTSLVRRMMEFQKLHVNPIIERLDDDLKSEQKEAEQEEGVKEAGINNTPIFSGIFNLVSQLLLSIKADAVADFAITRMKEGKKVIIGFSNTLESFLDYLIQGDRDEKIKTDFSIILKRRLEKILTYTVTNAEGERTKEALNPDDYPIMGQEYYSILEEINEASTGITISPLDRILTRVKEAGFTVGEVTGRKKYVEFLPDGKHGLVKSRRIDAANDLFRRFNDNDIDCLLINQSGATGASAQAIKSKKAYVVNYSKDGTPIIPKSLEPKNEVKQRVMIILQAELDINKEVQKRGRINRTGQVFKPIYDYVISAIPAEERLMMMLQKKLKSLDANTTSNQKQSNKLLDVVDFLNVYGDSKVVEFLKNNPTYNELTGNILKFDGNTPSETTKNIEDKAHKVSGRVAILPVEMQSNFYKTVSESYQNLENQLKASGEWNLEVENMDLAAETVDKSAVMVGNSAKDSVFAGAVFLETCRVNNLRKPYKQSEVVNMVSHSLTITDDKGRTKKFTSDEKTDYLLQELYTHIEENEKHQLDYLKARKKDSLKEIENMPSLEKKKKADRELIIEEKTKKIEEEYELRIESIKNSSSSVRRLMEQHLKYFYPKRLLEYPLANYEEKGETVKCLCLGIDVNLQLSNPFAPSAMTLKIVLPNGMRLLRFPLTDSFISLIRTATNSNYGTLNANEREVDAFIEGWDELTKESRANRVRRFIVTGNILKGYGNSDYRYGGRLISYTTNTGLIKKGILLHDGFETKDIRVEVPINGMLNYISGMMDGQTLPLYGTMVTMQRRGNFYYVYLKPKNNPHIEIKNDREINSIAFNTEFEKKSGEWQNRFEGVALKKLLSILWEKYKMTASVTQTVFESIQDDFDTKDRGSNTIDGTEELIKKHNEALEEYERSKKFEVIDEKDLKRLDDLEKENYAFKKRIAELEGLRRLYKVSRLMNDDIRKRKREAEDAAKQTSQMGDGGSIGIGDYVYVMDGNIARHAKILDNTKDLILVEYVTSGEKASVSSDRIKTNVKLEEGGTIDSNRRFTSNDFTKLTDSGKFKATWSGYVWEIYPDGGGKVLGKFNPHKHTLFILGKKDKTNILVEWLQNNSFVSADEYAKLRDGGSVNKNYEIEIIENTPEKRRWKGIVSEKVYNILEASKNQGGFLRYDIDLYDDESSLSSNTEGLEEYLNLLGVELNIDSLTSKSENKIEISRIRDTENDDSFQLVSNSQELKEIYNTYATKFLTEKDDNDRLYSEGIGGAFIKFTDGGDDVEKIYVFEGDVPDLSKPLFEIYPNNTYL